VTLPVKPGESLKYHVDHAEVAPESVLGNILSQIRQGARVLELGCATGSMTRVLQGQRGCRVDAVELDGVAAEEARPFCERLLVDNLETLAWDGPFFAGQVYDHIVIADVLEHLRDPGRVLREVRGLVADGGSIIVSTPNIAFAGVQAALRAGWFPYGPTGLLDLGHVHFFTRFELEALMLGCGVVPVERRAVHWGPGDSEFGRFWQQLTPQDKQHLLDAADSTVYQWVITAELPSEAAWQRCVLFGSCGAFQERQFARLSEEADSLRRALEDAERRLRQVLDRGEAESARIRELETNLRAVREACDHAQVTLQRVLVSRSWRLTAPLRATTGMMASLRSNGVKAWSSLRSNGLRATLRRMAARILGRPVATMPAGPDGTASELLARDWAAYRAWLAEHEVLPADGEQRVALAVQSDGPWPRIGIVMPVYNPDVAWLADAIESVRRQWYPHWRLYLVDDCSTRERAELTALLERLSAEEPRVRVVWRERNGHISLATNDGLVLSEDDWVTFLDQDDLLAPHALWCVAAAVREHPQARVVYSDEDKIDGHGLRSEPHFKPDWNPDLLLSYNYVCHLAVYRREDVTTVGGLRPGFEGAQDYDLLLRVVEHCTPDQIIHVPRVLYHWRVHEGSTAHDVGVKPYAMEAGRRALQEAMQRRGVSATVTVDSNLVYRVRYLIEGSQPRVTIIVPTRNGGDLLRTCIDSVIALTDYANYDIVIVDNGSDQPQTLQLLQCYARHPLCSVVRDPRPFNYAALHNAVVPGVQGEYVLLLNDDIEVKGGDWLRELVSVAVQPGVGIVGARLLYPNDTLQHGGVVLVGGVAGHAHKHLPANHWGYMMRARVRQTLSGVTAACMLVKKTVYQQVGGMDERLAVAFNDVAFCLAVGQAGYRIVWTPYAELYHHESATRGYEHEDPEKQRRFEAEVRCMLEHWGERLREDPALNVNLDNMREDFALARPPRLQALP